MDYMLSKRLCQFFLVGNFHVIEPLLCYTYIFFRSTFLRVYHKSTLHMHFIRVNGYFNGNLGQPIFSDKVYNIFNRELQK